MMTTTPYFNSYQKLYTLAPIDSTWITADRLTIVKVVGYRNNSIEYKYGHKSNGNISFSGGKFEINASSFVNLLIPYNV